MAVRASVENVREFLEVVDLQERTEKGTPVYKINDVINKVKSINRIYGIIKQLPTTCITTNHQ